MLDLVTHDEARRALPAVRLEGRTMQTYGQRAELIGKYQHKFIVSAPGFRRRSTDTVLLLVTPGLTGSPKTADRR
jgi:hypothetical protein